MQKVVDLLSEMISFDTRSAVSNIPLADFMQSQLEHWEIERLDYVDAAGVAKTNIVAIDPESASPLVFAGHLDTVSAAGWDTDPFRAAIDGDRLTGLGAADMKGPVAAFIVATAQMDPRVRPKIVLTADEETTKQGAREVVEKSRLLRDAPPKCFLVCEPTCLDVLRGHRVDVQFVIHSHGRQAHSSTGRGLNANLQLVPFLADIRDLHLRLRSDVTLHDTQYDPPFCDLNFVIDNYGTFPNVTVGLATCRIKFRYSKSIDPRPVVEEIRRSAATHGLDIEVRPEAPPPELPADAPLVRAMEQIIGRKARVMGIGTEASEYSRMAPSLILGPGSIDVAHKPAENISIRELEEAVGIYQRIAKELPALL
ncbi:MAG: Acetylornithine deacetylase [Xanthobacteraceae bacterium]|nr:Acetylornithine deacetylase [Xanthobacteraceae bacterium]